MNSSIIRFVLGYVLKVEAVLMLLPCIVAVLYQERTGFAYLLVAAIAMTLGTLMTIRRPKNHVFYLKEGCVATALSWIFLSFFGALPFWISGEIPSLIDALFETVSGFTTTGSSILSDVEALSHCALFWRSFTHWIGGMGVLVFVLMLTNLDKKNSMYLMRAEVPGPEKDKLVPKTKTTARILYGIYFGLTMILVILLMFGGMNLFDSLIHAFGSAGTGGFSNYADSVGHFDSAYIDYVISIFMILFGINFNLYYFMLLGDFKAFWKNEELRVYLGIVATATILITLNTNQMYGSIMKAFRYALFQVSTIITTTGYATTDFNLWPTFSQCILVLLMIIGACASSTGGGIKVSRLMIVFKGVKREIKQLVHPKSVNLIRINRKKISDETLRGVYVYLMAYALLAIVSVLIISLDNQDFTTTFTSVMATLNNIGPGLSAVGPTGNFADFSILSKIVFCIDMLAGRLEIFPFLTFLTMFAWKRKF